MAASVLSLAGPEVVKGVVGAAAKDAYDALKDRVARWGGHDVKALEANPASVTQQQIVAKIVDQQSDDARAEVHDLAQKVLAALKAGGPIGLDVARLEAIEVKLGAISVSTGTGVRIGEARVPGTFQTGDITVGETPVKKN